MFYDYKKHGITQSILSSWLKCRVYSKLTLDGWTPRRDMHYLHFGELAHGALEDLYKNKKAPSKIEVLNCITKQIKKLKKSKEIQDEKFLEQLEYQGSLLDALLPNYFSYWEKEDYKKIHWKALEEEFKIELPISINNKIHYIPIKGKMDGVYTHENDFYLFETKTKSRIDTSTLQELLMMDFQTMVYSLAIWKVYGKIPKGVRYNIIRRPGNKPKANEDLLTFSKRLESLIKKDPKKYFIRYKISIDKQHIIDFEKELKHIVKEFVLWRENKRATYKNTQSCTDRYGSCSMLAICAYENYSGFYKRKDVFQELNNKEVKK